MALMRDEADGVGPIAGEGVVLRAPQMADYDDWARLRAESRDFLTPWEPAWPADDLTRAAFKRRLRRYNQDVRDGIALPFFVFRESDGVLVGACNLSAIRRGVLQSASIGYWVGRRHRRRGYTRAAVRAAVRFSFERLGLHRVEAACIPANEPSRALLEGVGFRLEGYARHYLKIDGAWRDHLLFAVLNTDTLLEHGAAIGPHDGALEAELGAALNAGRMQPHYQPIACCRTGRILGFEALARWPHPERGVLEAGSFLRTAERGGLSPALADRMIARAAAQLADWRARGAPEALFVAVNVSARDLEGEALALAVEAARARHGLPEGALVLEVTETETMRDRAAAGAALHAAKQAGAGLALDDFGTGYSSLARLADFPFDMVKTDAAFSAGLPGARPGEAVLRAVVAMARELDLKVVAEGVESEAAAARLCELGADAVQGYAIGRPAPAEAAERLLSLRAP